MTIQCHRYEPWHRSTRCQHYSRRSKACRLLPRSTPCVEYLRANGQSTDGHPMTLQLKADAKGTERAQGDSAAAQGAKRGTAEGAPVAGTAGLAPLVISLDPHAAEMIVALREIFPHAEISIDKDNG